MDHGSPEFLVVGHMNKCHGTKGELFVWPLTDHPEGSFAPGVVLYPVRGNDPEPDPDLPPLRVLQARPFKKGFLLSLGGIEDRSTAEQFRGLYVMRAIEELEPLDDDELFYHDLLGMEVVTESGTVLGPIREVYELEPAHLLEIEREGGNLMLPYIGEFIVSVDRDARRMTVAPPEGLLDL